MTVSPPAIDRDGFETTEPDVANAALANMYGDVRSWVFGDSDQFTYRLHRGASPSLSTAHMRFSMGFGIDAELAASHHTFLAMLGGDHYHVESQYGQATLRPGDVAVVPGGASLQVSLHALDVVTLSVFATEVSRVAEELHGISPEDFSVLDMNPRSPQSGRYWRRLVGAASSELLAEDSALEEPLIYEDTLRSLCAGFLAAFPTTATGQVPSSPGELTPRALRRAVAFIDANAERPLTLSDIADAAGTSGRAVQHAFARHRETTPMAYLRRVRLERAHRDLQAADPTRGATVGTIARRWGFAKPGRFASAYRNAYGVTPRQTLRT